MDGDRRQARSAVGYTSGYAGHGSFRSPTGSGGRVGCAGRAGPVFRAARGIVLRHPQTPGFNLSIAIGESSPYIRNTSRRGLAPSPTCLLRQGGFHKSGMWPFQRQTSRFAPDLLVKGGFNDGANSLQATQQSNNAQTRPHWGCCFTDMCARNRAGHKFDASSSPATAVWASVCRVCRTFISSRARPSFTSGFASWPNEYPFQWQNIPRSRRTANSRACAELWMAAAIHFHIPK